MNATLTVARLAEMVGGSAHGAHQGDHTLNGLNTLERAQSHEVSFLANPRYVASATTTQAGCVLISEALYTADVAASLPASTTVIVVADAYRAFVQLMRMMLPAEALPQGMRAPSAVVDTTASVAATAAVGPGCVVSAGCVIADGVQLVANVVLYPNVHVGAGSIIHANVTVGRDTHIGERCVIHPGVVIGADGFGFLEQADGSYEKIPQVGTVVIEDDVEIGANTCIDRAAVGCTVIGRGVKLDNLVHIAHGVRLGEHTAIAAQTGVSGSAVLGRRNRIAGQVGIVGHITTADDVTVMAQSGVAKGIAHAGVYFGSPAKDHRTALRIEGVLRRLPDLARDVEELKQIVAAIRADHDHEEGQTT